MECSNARSWAARNCAKRSSAAGSVATTSGITQCEHEEMHFAPPAAKTYAGLGIGGSGLESLRARHFLGVRGRGVAPDKSSYILRAPSRTGGVAVGSGWRRRSPRWRKVSKVRQCSRRAFESTVVDLADDP
jgi:hypothetical protein